MPEHRHPHLRTNGHAPGGVRRALRARREPRPHRGATVRGGARALVGGGSHGARPDTPDPHPDRGDHQAVPGAGRLAPVLGGLRLLVARRALRRRPLRAGRADCRPGTCAAGHRPGPAHRTPLVGQPDGNTARRDVDRLDRRTGWRGSGRAAVLDGVGMGAPAARRSWTRICRKGIPYRAACQSTSQSVPAAEADLPAFASRVRSLQAEVVRQIEAELGVSAVTFAAALPGAEPLTFIEMEEGAAGAPTRQALRQSESGRPGLLRGIRRLALGGPHVRRQGFRRGGNGDRRPDVRATGGRRRQCHRPPGQAGSCPRIGGRPLVRDRRDRSRPSREHVPGTNVCSGAAWRAWTHQPNPTGPACRARSGRDVASPSGDRHEPRSDAASG